MNDKQIYIAYVLDANELGTQLLRFAFEHPRVEYWAESPEQAQLKAYFKEHHYTHQEPLVVEASELVDYLPFTRNTYQGKV